MSDKKAQKPPLIDCKDHYYYDSNGEKRACRTTATGTVSPGGTTHWTYAYSRIPKSEWHVSDSPYGETASEEVGMAARAEAYFKLKQRHLGTPPSTNKNPHWEPTEEPTDKAEETPVAWDAYYCEQVKTHEAKMGEIPRAELEARNKAEQEALKKAEAAAEGPDNGWGFPSEEELQIFREQEKKAMSELATKKRRRRRKAKRLTTPRKVKKPAMMK